MAPSDNSYYVWNASGNQVSCSIQGFTTLVGASCGVLYSCSLNLYSLAVVKYKKTDRHIRSKVEPFLHGVPIAFALIVNITLLAKQNLNDTGGRNCYAPIYRPPHWIGYEDGQTREGFNIPCGRGHDGAVLFYYVNGLGTLFIAPLVIGFSLWMIRRSVLNQENNMASYGANNFTAGAQQPDRSNSRVVLHRALAYSISYFLTWAFVIVGRCFDIANMEWPTFVWYLSNLFNPLQGFYNFMILMYPKVIRAESRGGGDMTWFEAFKIAFWGGGTNQTAARRRQLPNRIPHAPVVRGGTSGIRDLTTTEQLVQEDEVNLGSERKGEENIDAVTAGDIDVGHKKGSGCT